MNILNKLAITNLKLNKKRSIVTTIGIVLATALICAASNMFTSSQATLVDATIAQGGYYHVKLSDLTKDDVQKLEANRDIKDLNLITDYGFSNLKESKNPRKPYLHMYSIYDEKTFYNMSYNLKEGRLPKDNTEAVINEWIIENGEVPYKIGDKISLNLGTRTVSGEKINPKNQYKKEEELVGEYKKELTVVGIIKKPGRGLESTLEPGYTVITSGEKYEKTNSYLLLKDPYKYKETFEELLGKDYGPNHANYKYTMNSELLRWEVFNVSDSIFRMLLSLVIFGVLIICLTSIFCIRNSFAISTTEKIKMYGILASVGATKKQIKKNVLFEAFVLSAIGIPLGILFGVFADFVLIKICNMLLEPGVIQQGEIVFKASWIAIIASVIMGIITIYFSALSSARKASKVNPIESIRGTNEIKIKSKKLKTPKIIDKLFGIGGVIAYKNLKRSRRKYRTTVLSLISSIFIFITMSTFLKYGFDMTDEYYIKMDYNVTVGKERNDETNLNDVLKLDNIIDYTMIYTGSDDGMGQIKITDKSKVNEKFAYDYDIISVVALNSDAYKKYVKKLGLNYEKVKNDGVLCDDHGYEERDENGSKKKVLTRYYKYKTGDIIEGKYGNDERIINVKLSKVTDIRPSGYETVYINGGFLFVDVNNFDKIKFAEENILINSSNPDKLTKDIEKEFKTLRVSNLEQMAKYQRGTAIVMSIFMYGFIGVITLIGLTNIFNTITANMNLRQKEFATLKSIGMTKKEFNKMINLETIFYSLKSLIFGIALGILGSYMVYGMFATSFDSGFKLPYKSIILSIIFVFIIIFGIMKYSIKNIDKQNIIETIRNENV